MFSIFAGHLIVLILFPGLNCLFYHFTLFTLTPSPSLLFLLFRWHFTETLLPSLFHYHLLHTSKLSLSSQFQSQTCHIPLSQATTLKQFICFHRNHATGNRAIIHIFKAQYFANVNRAAGWFLRFIFAVILLHIVCTWIFLKYSRQVCKIR